MSFVKSIALIITVLVLMPNAYAASPSVITTDLGTLGGLYSSAHGINAKGQVVGESTTSNGGTHAFMWHNGIMTDLGTLGGDFSKAFDINIHGQVVGQSTGSDGASRAFLWQDGIMKDLGTLGGIESAAYAINDKGEIICQSSTSSGVTRSYLWNNGLITDLGTLGGDFTYGYDINKKAEVVEESANHAFIWQKGVMEDLGTLGDWPEYEDRSGLAINAKRQVAGYGVSGVGSNVDAPFIWESGVMARLWVPSGEEMIAYDINARGQVVGTSGAPVTGSHSWVWYNGLTTELPSILGPDGAYDWTKAAAINDHGEVVGYSRVTKDFWNGYHATLWKIEQ